MSSKTLKYVILFLLSFQLYSQNRQDDYFPLRVGNSWMYKYSTYRFEQLADYIVTDTGLAKYSVVAKTVATDSILWNILQLRNVTRHYHKYFPPNVDTTYNVTDSVTFNVVEYLANNHRLISWSNWETVFCFSRQFIDSNSFYRYYPLLKYDTSSFSIYTRYSFNNYIAEEIKLSIQKNIGITFSSYSAPGITGWVPKSNHVLLEAMITSMNVTHDEVIVDNFTLSQNYPNPFNPITSLTLKTQKECSLSINVYDELGRLIYSIDKKNYQSGVHTLYWNASQSSSGVYFCVARSDKFSKSIKMVLLK